MRNNSRWDSRWFANSVVLSLFLFGCSTSGPVKTEVELNKNKVVSQPRDFQSPIDAIDQLSQQETKAKDMSEAAQFTRSVMKSLIERQKSIAAELLTTGQLLLRPGTSYQFDVESFCVNSGIEQPVSGDGLLIGAIEGPAKSWLPEILGQYAKKNISQTNAQLLIWSLLSGAKFDELGDRDRSTALKLFPDASLRFGHSKTDGIVEDAIGNWAPSTVKIGYEKYRQFKSLLRDSKQSFEDIEAVLAPHPSKRDPIPTGWIQTPDGYFVSLTSRDYSSVTVKIFAPQNLAENTYFEPIKVMALPGKGQRLGISANFTKDSLKYLADRSGYLLSGKPLTESEKELVDRYPVDALYVARSVWDAQRMAFRNFPDEEPVDTKSDAFRHFIWASLLERRIGYEKAKSFLDAHEEDPSQKNSERLMDIYNNSIGLNYAKAYSGQDFEKDLEREGLEKIRRRELKWLK